MLSRRASRLLSTALTLLATAAILLVSQPSRVAVITFAGDVMLSRGLEPRLAENGFDYPYAEVRGVFLSDDLTLVNLECPLTDAKRSANKSSNFIFKASHENAAALKRNGVDIVSLANNHTMDYLSQGLADTMNTLRGAGVDYIGATLDGSEPTAAFYDVNGVRLGFLAFSCLPSEGYVYLSGYANIAFARSESVTDVLARIAAAAASCDVLTIYYHWGIEYERTASDWQRKLARDSFDAGASIVVGSHPHVTQETERYGGGLIAYSLGNFVFDRQIPPHTDESVILQVTVSPSGIDSVAELPVRIVNGQARIVE